MNKIPTRSRCSLCHNEMPIGFCVPTDIWEQAIPEKYRDDEICLNCFLRFADNKLVDWDKDIQFEATSLKSHIEFLMEFGIFNKVEDK